MVRVASVTPPTSGSPYRADPLPIPLELVETTGLPTLPTLPEITQANLPVPVNLIQWICLVSCLKVYVILALVLCNLEQIYILTITSTTQLETLKVDFVKKAIQVLCWECFQIGILKRNFKMWLQTSPPNTPGLPYGRFCAVDYDMPWKEVLDLHLIPHDQRHIHLRAHHSESTQE